MNFLSLLFSLIFVLPSTSLHIILPLYLYPDSSASAWGNITATVAAYPAVQWEIVVNPNSGPGTTSYPTDPNIIAGIAKLNSYPNVHTVGYVDTAHGQKALSSVTAEVDVYAKWANYSSANITIGGIYFDDVSSTESNSSYEYYHSASAHAYASMASSRVVFNPGTIAPTQLFSYCDTMVEYENSLANYQSDVIQKIPSIYRGKSALQVYSTPETADVKSLVRTMAQAEVEAVYLGIDCCYNVFSATLLQAMAEAI